MSVWSNKLLPCPLLAFLKLPFELLRLPFWAPLSFLLSFLEVHFEHPWVPFWVPFWAPSRVPFWAPFCLFQCCSLFLISFLFVNLSRGLSLDCRLVSSHLTNNKNRFESCNQAFFSCSILSTFANSLFFHKVKQQTWSKCK